MKSLSLFLIVLVLAMPVCGRAEFTVSESPFADNPLINRQANRVAEYLKIPEGIINILLMGIDSDAEGKDYTYRIEESHTDTMIVLAVNPKENRIDMISVPRDTMAYVPGTRGVYKLNCAINVGATRAGKPAKSPEGFEAVRDTVSWLLGGIRIDYYMAIDMEAMAAIGDAIGGVDFDVEMTYSGENGRRYRAGRQHLDGIGIVDYFRARKNATINSGSDLARTGRQRALLTAVFRKLMTNQGLLFRLLRGTDENPAIRNGFFMDISVANMAALLQVALTFVNNANTGSTESNMQSYAISGTYRNAFGNWKFTFTDQDNRRAVIKEVYGADVPELKYISYPYAKWLYTSGFTAVRHLSAADGIKAYIAANADKLPPGEKLDEALEGFNAAYRETQETFIQASETQSEEDTRLMSTAANALKDAGNTLAKMIGYPKKGGNVSWKLAKYHDDDKLVNEVYVNFR